MAFMQWDETYTLNIVIIDDQHQRLFELINQFKSASADIVFRSISCSASTATT